MLNKNVDNKIQQLIEKYFPSLNKSHKNLLYEELKKTINTIYKYFMSNGINEQFLLNNGKDTMSCLVLLFPYFNLFACDKLQSLEEILNNSSNNAYEKFSSTYYIDHENIDIVQYFKNAQILIEQTMAIINNKLFCNWKNVFPHTLKSYTESTNFLQFDDEFRNNKLNNTNSHIGYETIYPVCVKFLYEDILPVKWLIFEINDKNDNFTKPFVIWLADNLKIHDIYSFNYNNTNTSEVEILWNKIYENNKGLYLENIIQMIIYYLKNNSKNRNSIKSSNIQLFSKINIIISEDIDDLPWKNFWDTMRNDNNLQLIIFNSVNIMDILKYIKNSIHHFSYTWYGTQCLNNDKTIKTFSDYKKDFIDDKKLLSNGVQITLKMFYNFFKSLTHKTIGTDYVSLSKSHSWYELSETNKELFINRLNNINKSWFNVSNNIKRITSDIDTYYNNMIHLFKNGSYNISNVIFETLVINGIYSKIIFNNESFNPKNADLSQYESGYSFLTNTQYGNKINKITKNRPWYNLFGSNWVCQIQIFHHFIHNRIIYVTGGTGAGKSSIYPFLTLYASKAFNYNNNSNIICTVPRIKPSVDNANSNSLPLGVELIENDVNYIRVKTSKHTEYCDNYYHPKLTFITDKTAISMLLNNPILYGSVNVLLVDESHENTININMILTLMRFATYINNSLILGIISATMDFDEKIYRTYYKLVDDNLKYPLNIDNKHNRINRKYLDRRMHMSEPFKTTNYTIVEEPYVQNKTVLKILEEIYKKPDKGDILIFENGSGEIRKRMNDLYASNKCGERTIILPIHSEINDKITTEICSTERKKKVRISRNKDLFNMTYNEFINSTDVGEYYYTRFIFVATNIAEASITIDGLSYVIDNGTRRESIYDYENKENSLSITNISHPNRKQRIGRVGRSANGWVYYLYDPSTLSDKPSYPISSQYIVDTIIELLTKTPEKKIIYNKFDPNYEIHFDKIPKQEKEQEKEQEHVKAFIEKHYCYYTNDDSLIHYYIKNKENKNNNDKENKNNNDNIVFPYSDGKYHITDLIDTKGNFYIIHPNENNIIRNINDYSIQSHVDENALDRLQVIMNIFKEYNIINDTDVTEYGKYFIIIQDILKKNQNEILIKFSDVNAIITSFSYNDDKMNYCIFHLLQKILIVNSSFKTPEQKIVRKSIKSEIICKTEKIKSELFHYINLNSILDIINRKINKLPLTIEQETLIDNKIDDTTNIIDYFIYNDKSIELVNKLVQMIDNDYIKMFKDYFINYYCLKIKIEALLRNEELTNTIQTNKIILSPSILKFNNYNSLCYLLVTNNKDNLVKKIQNIPIYSQYNTNDLNKVYMITFVSYPNGKRKIFTDIDENYRYGYLLYFTNINNLISNLYYIDGSVVTAANIKKSRVKNRGVTSSYPNNMKMRNEDFLNYMSQILKS